MIKKGGMAVLFGMGALCLLPTLALAAGPFQFHAITPCRVVYTRTTNATQGTNGSPIVSDTVPRYLIQTQCGVPSGAAAATLNLTVVNPTKSGFITAEPVNQQGFGGVSTLNYNAGEPALANGAIVPLGTLANPPNPTGKDLKILVSGMVGGGTAHLVIDVTGYFQ